MRIRTGLCLMLIPLVAVPMLLLGRMAAQNARKASAQVGDVAQRIGDLREEAVAAAGRMKVGAEERARQDYAFSLRQIDQTLQASCDFLERLIETQAASPVLVGFLNASEDNRNRQRLLMEELFGQTVRAYGLSEVSVVDPAGKEIYRVAMDVVPPGGDPDFDAYPLGNKTTDEGKSDWFAALRGKKGHFVSSSIYFEDDFSMDPHAGGKPQPVLSLACPIRFSGNRYDRRGDMLMGYLRFAIKLADFAGDLTAGGERKVLLAAPGGNILHHDDPSALGKDVSDEYGAVDPSLRFEAPALKGLARLVLIGNEADIQAATADVAELEARIVAAAGDAQSVAAVWSQEAGRIAARARRATAAAVGLATLLLLAIAQRISSAAIAIARRANAMAKGQFEGGEASGTRSAFREFQDLAGSMEQVADSFLRLLGELGTLTDGMVQNDLTNRIRGEYPGRFDELKRGLNSIVENQRAFVRKLRDEIADGLASGSEQVADASQNLSQGATETAASLQQISASAARIGDQARHNAETATQANQLAGSAKTAAESGAKRMDALNGSMAGITESSAQIAKIIKTIDDIAFQTNILALNAAVEAARAGRHGKGFAVVAGEVRTLAARSAKAARETADLIEHSKQRVNDGNRVAQDTAGALADIVDSIVKVGDLVGEMAAASNEQAQGIAEIGQGLGQIDQVTQQNTATAEETAASSEEMSSYASEMKSMLALFKLDGDSGALGGSRPKALPPADSQNRKALPAPSDGNGGEEMIRWSEAYSVGNRKMDEQHKKLIDLVNHLYAAMRSGRANDVVATILQELIDYTATHFADEENLMKKYNCPELGKQQAMHKELVRQVLDLQEQFSQGQPLGTRVFHFLKGWLVNHIQNEDRKYGAYVPK
jgi:hemerythrin-like metal-binding protein